MTAFILVLVLGTVLPLVNAQFQRFVTRPFDKAVDIKIHVDADRSKLAPGYFFVTPYFSDFTVGSFGPQIFDADGMLVWYGNHTVGHRAIDGHVCHFGSEARDHICFNDADRVEQGGHSSGVVRFLDNTYKEVHVQGPINGLRGPDIHELNTPEHNGGTTFIQDVYQPRQVDLTTHKGPKEGWVLDGCFQEIEFATKQVVFQWCTLDHIDIDMTYLRLPGDGPTHPISGKGTKDSPYDYIHLNAIDKNAEGDYLVSCRAMDTIYKIAGQRHPSKDPGEIIWALNGNVPKKIKGRRADFELLDGLNFTRQHAVRFHDQNETHTVLALFDNADDGLTTSAPYSSGKMIVVNNQTMQAELLAEYRALERTQHRHSGSQGSIERLSNGNVLIGWGAVSKYSEHTADGKLLYFANFGAFMQSFRVYKSLWKGYPTEPPDLVAYALDCDADVHAHVSWNGATEVKYWKFYVTSSKDGSDRIVMNHRHGQEKEYWLKMGFETSVPLGSIKLSDDERVQSVYAEALDDEFNVLSTSRKVEVFIPKNPVAWECNERRCKKKNFNYWQRSRSTQCLDPFPLGHDSHVEWVSPQQMLIDGV